MGTSGCRKFGMADGMILVGALSVGFAAVRWIIPGPGLSARALWDDVARLVRVASGDPVELFRQLAGLHMVFGIPCLVALSAAWAAIALRRPRPPWRRLARQPGVAACVLATLALPLGLALKLGIVGLFGRRGQDWQLLVLSGLTSVSAQAGAAVLWGWSALALAGRWRPAPTWIDRVGRVLGVLWVGTGLLQAVALASL